MNCKTKKAPDQLIYCDPETGEKIDLMPSLIALAKSDAEARQQQNQKRVEESK